jgi:uncharacterized membrane protein YuzA (DUF378 family)
MKHYPTINLISSILLVIGGLNWGLVGLFEFDLIGSILHELLGRVVFVLIGLAAVWRVFLWLKQRPAKR